MKEVWENIKGYEGYYQISNLGRVKSLERVEYPNGCVKKRLRKTKIMKLGIDGGGYKWEYYYER